MILDAPIVQPSPDALFLLSALRSGIDAGSLAANAHERVMVGLSRIASRDMDALVLRESHEAAREVALSGALHRASLGLEYGAEGDAERAVGLLADGAIAAAANTGAAILGRIQQQADAVRGALRMTSDLPTALSVVDELYLANTVEDMFLDELSRGRMTAVAVTPRLTESLPARWIASLEDVRVVSGMLLQFNARASLFQSFARERLFAQSYPTDALGGCDAIAMTRMFVLAVISGDPQPRFHIEAKDIAEFPADGFRSPELEQWCAAYIADALPQAELEPACDYVRACLAAAPDLLDSLL